MIIIKYLVKETIKSQVAILFILLLIFFSQKLVRILGTAVNGEIPTNLILSLLGLGVPEMAKLILPLSLFLGLLITYGKLYIESEITVMHACGLGKKPLLTAALFLAIVTSALAAANVFWFSPWSAIYEEKILNEARANPTLAALVEGQFRSSQDGNAVLFVGNVNGKAFNRVFLAQLWPDGNRRPSVVVAESGHMSERSDGAQIVTLDKGTRYEGTALLRDFRITDFNDYQAVIGRKSITQNANASEQMLMSELWHSDHPDARAEFHWRLTLIVSVVIMALLVVPLSVVNPRQGRAVSMLPAMLLYLIFFLLQSTLRSNAGKGQLNPLIWLWIVNSVYLALAIAFNMWDSLLIRKLRARLRGVA